MSSLRGKIDESLRTIRAHTNASPQIALILGSGLGDFAETLPEPTAIPTSLIPHFPTGNVEGHKGRLLFSRFAEKSLLVFQGRVHFYETHSVEATVYPIRVAHRLGVKTLIITNAAGGVSRSLAPGDLMVITDQINLTLQKPPADLFASVRLNSPDLQVGVTKPRVVFWGFNPLVSGGIYDQNLIELAENKAADVGIPLKKGVYCGVAGPSYETASEVKMIHRLKGDAVGMSTVFEASAAAAFGMRVLGISCITNYGTGIDPHKLSHDEVSVVAGRTAESFKRLVWRALEEM
jgi:purine-nucleoside phosphorylase